MTTLDHGGHAASQDENDVFAAMGLYKTYHRHAHPSIAVLRGVSLSVRPFERVAIVGRSGAGKSTLLHVLGGLDCPDGGQVRLEGQDLYALPPGQRARIRARDIGFVFQSYHLMPEMDLLENVMLPAMAAGVSISRRIARRRARELLARVGLEGRMSHRPTELSGGEQQRAALARALMNHPRLILADEPTGNLDRGTGEQVLACLFDLVRDQGRALLVVTHDPATANRCDRVLRIEDGQIVNGAESA